MTEPHDHCVRCGATWKKADFGTDGNGNLILNHICRRTAIVSNGYNPAEDRYQREPQRRYAMKNCKACGHYFRAFTSVHIYCINCGADRRRKRDRAYKRGAAA